MSQYRDPNRVLHWVLAVLSEQNTNARIYRVSGGELPTQPRLCRPRRCGRSHIPMGIFASLATELTRMVAT
jgi:hypothetical protein